MEAAVILVSILTAFNLAFLIYMYVRHTMLAIAVGQVINCLTSVAVALKHLHAQDEQIAEGQNEFIKKGECN